MLSFCHPVSHDGRFYAAVTQIVPQVRGTVTEVPVETNEPLKEGDVLFRIERRPFELEVERLEAMLAGMSANAAQLEARLAAAEAATRVAQSQLAVSESEYDRQARIDLEQAIDQIERTQSRLDLSTLTLARYRELRPSGAITQQQLDEAESEARGLEAELAQAKAQRRAAEEKLESGSDRLQAARDELLRAEATEQEARLALEAESDGLNPEVRQTMAELERKRWELDQTVVRAPSDGYATYVGLRPGQMATPLPITAPMVFVTKERPTFIASFPQNVIPLIEPGLEAELAFKAYPGQIFKAKVVRIASIIPEGQFLASGQLQSFTLSQAPGHIPVVFEYGDDVADLNLPVGSQATVAVYTHHLHAISLVRKIVLRMKSWENYVFFLSNMNVGH
jgi:multidrug resistance efflux pump